MGYDLHSALHDYTRGPTDVPDVDVAAALARVRRRRALRSTAIGVGGAAAAAAVTVTAYALAGDGTTGPVPAPPATSDPAPTATVPAPRPTKPEPEPSATAPSVVTLAPLVGLTTSGELLALDPSGGAAPRVVTTGLPGYDPAKTTITVSTDGAWAYLSVVDEATADRSVLRVGLTDGAVERVAEGMHPALSPDGRTLALVAAAPDLGVDLVDLATGGVRHLSDGIDNPARWIAQAAWSADGTTLFVPRGWGDGGMDLWAVDVATATSLDDGVEVLPTETTPDAVASLGTRLAVSMSERDDRGEWARSTVTVVDPATGAEVVPGPDLGGLYLASMTASADGGSLALLLLDPAVDASGGQLVVVPAGPDGFGAAREVARDLVAIGW